MSTSFPDDQSPWSRRRLLALVAGLAALVLVLAVSLGIAVYRGTQDDPQVHQEGTGSSPAAGAAPTRGPAAGDEQARRDAIARRPMLTVALEDGIAGRPALSPFPAMQIPASGRTGPAQIITGYPRTPEGAVGQLAAITSAVTQAMSIPYAREVYQAWSEPGAPAFAEWSSAKGIRDFLEQSQSPGQEKDPSAVISAEPVAAQVKGTDGPDWTLACVLLDTKISWRTDTRLGVGRCEAMHWTGDRWVIAKGAQAAPAPSTWPGSEKALAAGWRTWVPAEAG